LIQPLPWFAAARYKSRNLSDGSPVVVRIEAFDTHAGFIPFDLEIGVNIFETGM